MNIESLSRKVEKAKALEPKEPIETKLNEVKLPDPINTLSQRELDELLHQVKLRELREPTNMQRPSEADPLGGCKLSSAEGLVASSNGNNKNVSSGEDPINKGCPLPPGF